jgi:putative DNA primase/helicase
MEMKKRIKKSRLARQIKLLHGYGPLNSWLTKGIVNELLEKQDLIYKDSEFYLYKLTGVWIKTDEDRIKKSIMDILGDKATKPRIEETFSILRLECLSRADEVKGENDVINLTNGLFDLNTLSIRKHTREIFSVNQLPISYDQNSQCPLWQKTLGEIFEWDEKKVLLVQEIFGCCMTRDVTQEKAFFFFGTGRNGKSVVIYVLLNIVGQENTSSVQFKNFGKDFYLVKLRDKLVNLSTESGSNVKLDDATFKAVVSGEMLPANEKYKPIYNFIPYAKLVAAMNELPKIDDKSEGSWERVVILPFVRYFKKEERDKQLKHNIVRAELSGIFNWAIEGLKRLRKQKFFTEPEDSIKALEEYRRQNSTVLMFLHEKFTITPDRGQRRGEEGVIGAQALYVLYQGWCKNNGYPRPETSVIFAAEIKRLYGDAIVRRKDRKGRFYVGLTPEK